MGSKAAVPYVHRHPKTGHLNYRRRLPEALRSFIPGNPREFVRTLAAHEIGDPGFTERHQAAAIEYDLILARAQKARSGDRRVYDELTTTLIDHFAHHYLTTELTVAKYTGNGPPFKRLYDPRDDRRSDFEESSRALQSSDTVALAEIWGGWVGSYAEALGCLIGPNDPLTDQLHTAIGRSACELWLSLEAKRLASNAAENPHASYSLSALRKSAVLNSKAPSSGTFESIATAILENDRQQIGESTKESASTALRFFREVYGTPMPGKITRAMVSEWVDLLAQRPSRLPKSQWATPLRRIVALYENCAEPRLAPKTYNGHVSSLATLWRKAVKTGQIRGDLANPFAGHRVSSAIPDPAEPKGFSREELQAILGLRIFRKNDRPAGGKGEASYWMPLLMLWTGARPEEVAQLMLEDFSQDDRGRWHITFTDVGIHPHKGQRGLKTTRVHSGRRTIPIPRMLLDLGLLRYVDWLRRRNEAALFPDLRTKGARKLLATGWTEWWGQMLYAEKILLKASRARQPSREFRHTWTTAARRCGVSRDAREYIQGHGPARGTANEDYGDREVLGDQIGKVDFDIDWTNVKPWQSQL